MPTLHKIIEKPISGEWGDEGDAVNVIRTTNFTNEGKIDFSKVVKRNIDEKKIKAKRLREGDIIIEKSGGGPTQPVGRVVIFENNTGDFLCNNFTSVLRPKKDLVFPKYLLYILLANHKYGLTNSFQNKTTGIINLKLQNYIDKTQIPLPPLPVQQKIAAILDAADLHRQKTKTLIEKYDQLTQSLFLEMFGDPVRNEKGFEMVQIKDLVSDVQYGTSSKSEDNGKYPYLRMNNISYAGYMNYSDLKYINLANADKNKFTVKSGDILFNRTNSKELVGKAGIIEHEKEMVFAGYLIRVRVNELANPYYVWAHLNSKWSKTTLRKMCKNIIGMANINAKELQSIKILKAPIDLQNKFADQVQQIQVQKEKAQSSMNKAEDLFNTLLQRAFKGELIN